MSITVEFHGPIARIILSGAIDYSTQEEVRNANSTALTGVQVREIHVNFAEVTFLDSSGIRALLMLQKTAEEQGKSLILLNCKEPIRATFEIGGFDKMFTMR